MWTCVCSVRYSVSRGSNKGGYVFSERLLLHLPIQALSEYQLNTNEHASIFLMYDVLQTFLGGPNSTAGRTVLMQFRAGVPGALTAAWGESATVIAVLDEGCPLLQLACQGTS